MKTKNTENWGRAKAAERYAKGGSVKVNINIAPKPSLPAMTSPLPPPGPPPMPPGGPGGPMAGPPGAPPPGPMKRGGAVHMTAGAGSGEGRKQKIREYGGKSRA